MNLLLRLSCYAATAASTAAASLRPPLEVFLHHVNACEEGPPPPNANPRTGGLVPGRLGSSVVRLLLLRRRSGAGNHGRVVQVAQVARPPHQDQVLDQNPVGHGGEVEVQEVYSRQHPPVIQHEGPDHCGGPGGGGTRAGGGTGGEGVPPLHQVRDEEVAPVVERGRQGLIDRNLGGSGGDPGPAARTGGEACPHQDLEQVPPVVQVDGAHGPEGRRRQGPAAVWGDGRGRERWKWRRRRPCPLPGPAPLGARSMRGGRRRGRRWHGNLPGQVLRAEVGGREDEHGGGHLGDHWPGLKGPRVGPPQAEQGIGGRQGRHGREGEGGKEFGKGEGGGRGDGVICVPGTPRWGCELNQRNARHIVVELPQQPPEDTTVWEGS